MLIRQGFKFRMDETPAQAARFRVLAGHRRFVWNKAQRETDAIFKAKDQWVPRYESMAKWLTEWKKDPDMAFLKDAYTDNLQQCLKDLDQAWQNYFNNHAFGKPQPKKKGKCRDSARFVNFNKYCKLENNRVKLPAGIGWVKFRKSRAIVGTIKSATIGFEQGHWFISFQTEQEVADPVHPATSMVGVDLGITRFMTLSDGSYVEPLNAMKKGQKKLAKAQRDLARKEPFSKNWKKQKAKVNKLYGHIANARRDYLHKVTTTLCKNHAVIVLEDLKVKNMSATAKGTVVNPGTNVKAKSGLNRSILDQGWYEFRRQVEYKQQRLGGQAIIVPPNHTSQKCPECRYVHQGNRRSQATFDCLNCGFKANADWVGSYNIEAKGHFVLACGEQHPLLMEAGTSKLSDRLAPITGIPHLKHAV